jgi:hypothetical protein
MSFAVTATVAAVATAGSLYSAEKSRKAQKQANRAQERGRQVQDARSRMAQVREQRIAQAQIVQGAATQGLQQSSGAQGGYSAVGSLSAGNMQFTNQMDHLQSSIYQHMQSANKWSGRASTASGLANLAMAAGSMASPATPAQSGGSTGSLASQTPTVWRG